MTSFLYCSGDYVASFLYCSGDYVASFLYCSGDYVASFLYCSGDYVASFLYCLGDTCFASCFLHLYCQKHISHFSTITSYSVFFVWWSVLQITSQRKQHLAYPYEGPSHYWLSSVIWFLATVSGIINFVFSKLVYFHVFVNSYSDKPVI